MDLQKLRVKAAAIAAGGALLLSSTFPVLAADIQVSGNGADSSSQVSVSKDDNTQVSQSNTFKADNTVVSNSSTGGNTVNDNTGGDVAVVTGNVDNRATIENSGNTNHAVVDNCNCGEDTNINVSGNGARSDNTVKVNDDKNTSVWQDNRFKADNTVKFNGDTGHNRANDNTGGDVYIDTGSVRSNAEISNTANANVAQVGGSGSGGSGGSKSIWVTGNGAGSDNKVALYGDRSTSIVQDNDAKIRNKVSSDGDTGHNYANYNTGGDVAVITGNVNNRARIDNLANFNSASVDNCGCLVDLNVKVHGNGARSDNKVKVDSNKTNDLWQDNRSWLDNYFKSDSSSGYNRVSDSTAYGNSDPTILTGNVGDQFDAYNTANLNHYGSGHDIGLPGGMGLDLKFDLGGMMNWFGH